MISKCQSVSDLLEVGVLLKEVGLLRGDALALNIVPLFETIDDLERCGAIMHEAFALPQYRRWLAGRAATGRKSCSATRTATRTAAI